MKRPNRKDLEHKYYPVHYSEQQDKFIDYQAQQNKELNKNSSELRQLWRMTEYQNKELKECLNELVELVDDKDYKSDSFTTQPARKLLNK